MTTSALKTIGQTAWRWAPTGSLAASAVSLGYLLWNKHKGQLELVACINNSPKLIDLPHSRIIQIGKHVLRFNYLKNYDLKTLIIKNASGQLSEFSKRIADPDSDNFLEQFQLFQFQYLREVIDDDDAFRPLFSCLPKPWWLMGNLPTHAWTIDEVQQSDVHLLSLIYLTKRAEKFEQSAEIRSQETKDFITNFFGHGDIKDVTDEAVNIIKNPLKQQVAREFKLRYDKQKTDVLLDIVDGWMVFYHCSDQALEYNLRKIQTENENKSNFAVTFMLTGFALAIGLKAIKIAMSYFSKKMV